MPILHFKGKSVIQNHHHTVKFHELVAVKGKGLSKEPSLDDNLIIHGDNLIALKALLPTYAGKVKCIYIDPPYNTGNEHWVYNDNVNSPMIREWIGKEVARDDLSRHDKWCCMMYPRLRLLQELLSKDGVIFVSIDDNEIHNLRSVMDEVFGEENFVTTIHVQMSTVQGEKVRSAKQGNIVKNAEYILVYSMNGSKQIGRSPLYEPSEYDTHYSLWLSESKKKGVYEEGRLNDVVCKNDELFSKLLILGLAQEKKGGRSFSINEVPTAYRALPDFRSFIHGNAHRIARVHTSAEIPEKHIPKKMVQGKTYKVAFDKKQYYVGIDGKEGIKQRLLLSDKIKKADDYYNEECITTIRGDWWSGFYIDMGNISKEGGVEYKNGKKPVRLIKQLINFVASDKDIILDSFAGSGTTGHAVVELNESDKGSRRYILIQCDEVNSDTGAVENVCEKRTAMRLRSVKSHFSYFEIGKPIDMDKMLEGGDLPSFKNLANYAFFTATGETFDPKKVNEKEFYIGSSNTYEVFLFYVPDADKLRGMALNLDFAQKIEKKFPGKPKLVFAPACFLEEYDLRERNIRFAQLPFEIYRLAE
ncbi:MAG: site-specific DNA-methyltransferase [Candidatus Peregrinibacteria bacterium]